MRQELFANASTMKDLPPQIDAVILLDRSVDLITPLSTQLTYEGLIDEIFGIKHGEWSLSFPLAVGYIYTPSRLCQVSSSDVQ